MIRATLTTACLIALSLVISSPANADFDAAGDFSPTNNPNGVWSYGSSTILGSAFVLGTTQGNHFGIDYWVNDFTVAVPTIIHNGTGSAITFSTVTLQAGQLGFHPGPNDENAVVRFTTPSAGSYSLETAFTGLDIGTTTDVHILLNGVSIFDGIVNGNAPGSGPSFSTILALNLGDKVDFSVGYGTGGYANDSTSLSARLSPRAVPEPASIAILVIGLSGTFFTARRRKIAV